MYIAKSWAIEVQRFEFVDRGRIVGDRLLVSPSLSWSFGTNLPK